MMASLNHQERLMQKPNPNYCAVEEYNDVNAVEDDDTLSLSDLPIHIRSEDRSRDFDQEYYNYYVENEDQSFEFFSDEWVTANANSFPVPPENIVFCGSLIPSRRQTPSEEAKNSNINGGKHSCTAAQAPENRSSTRILNNGSKRGQGMVARRVPENHGLASRNKVEGRSSWEFFYGFGLVRFPVKMDLRGIRSRQMRQISRQRSLSDSGRDKVVMSDGRTGEKRLCRLIRNLSCGGEHQSNAMVKASLVCVPRV